MINKLTYYLAKTISAAILLTLLLVLGIEWIFDLVNELKNVGTGDYFLFDVFKYLLLSAPGKLYQVFPMCALIGTMMGLGVMANQSELVAMRSMGLSILDISNMIVKTSFVLALLSWGIGEFVAPRLQYIAHNQKTYALSGGQAMQTAKGIWLRDGHDFVHVQHINTENNYLEGVTRYAFDHNFLLKKASFAEYAHYKGKQWEVHNIQETEFFDKKTVVHTIGFQIWKSQINPDVIRVVGVKGIENLSIIGIWRMMHYRHNNKLSADNHQLAFWQKLTQPLATVLMMFLAIPFVFGPLRESSLGVKMVTGIGVGFLFLSLNNLMGPLAILLNLPAWLAVFLPLGLFFGAGVYLMRKAW